jgi:hypothetical protein
MCIDRVLPLSLKAEAEVIAAGENPENAPDSPVVTKMALLTRKRWKPGRTLKVRFLDGASSVQERVVLRAKEWEKHANIHFDFNNDANAEIRIAFGFNPGSSWSALGTDALVEKYFPKHEPTMNFGWFDESTDEDELSRVGLHELGHALGCIHEHSNPNGSPKWNKDAVYKYFSGAPNFWPKDQIDHNVIEKYSPRVLNATKFDPDSIMLYEFAAELIVGGVATHSNKALSATDIEFIGKMYPF